MPRLIRTDSKVLLAILGCALWAACSPTRSAPAVARAFVDRFLVEANQRAALPLTEGLARVKVEEELRLLAKEPPSDAAERPRIFYRQLDEQTQDDGITFHFRLTVVVIGDPPLEPELIVRVRSSAGEWRVSNFEVLPPREVPPAA